MGRCRLHVSGAHGPAVGQWHVWERCARRHAALVASLYRQGLPIALRGCKGLAFSALISQYDVRQQKGGDTRVTIKTRNDEDDFGYTLQIYTNGRVDLTVVMRERERISYSGRLDLDKEGRP